MPSPKTMAATPAARSEPALPRARTRSPGVEESQFQTTLDVMLDSEATFPGTHTAALARWQAFLPQATRYAALRNQVVPGHPHVTRLSPALRARLVTTEELVGSLLETCRFAAAEKLVQELVWRDYWKGWLELRPSVWSDYRAEVDRLRRQADPALLRRAEAVMAGQGGIAVLDGFTRELIETGYLHNHARMWWAGYWIHVERLPWALGADFFYRHLLDADPASNTLGWRWVAGLQTRGKAYLPRRSNLEKYCAANLLADPTGLERIDDSVVAAVALPDERPAERVAWKPLPDGPSLSGGSANPPGTWGLWVHGEDLSVERSGLACLCPAVALSVFDAQRVAALGMAPRRIAYLKTALADGLARAGHHFQCPTESCETGEGLAEALARVARERSLAGWVAMRPSVGPLADAIPAIEAALARDGRKVIWCRRRWDEHLWPQASAGFFGFWEKAQRRLATQATALAQSRELQQPELLF
jgi:deoxyribodipyrimidine photo-lyase